MFFNPEVLIAVKGTFTRRRLEHMCRGEGLSVTFTNSFADLLEQSRRRLFAIQVIEQDYLVSADENWLVAADNDGLFAKTYTLILSRDDHGYDAVPALELGAKNFLPVSASSSEVVSYIIRYLTHTMFGKTWSTGPLSNVSGSVLVTQRDR